MADNITRNVIFPSDLVELTDKEADRLGMSFAGFLRLLLNQYFNRLGFPQKTELTEAVSNDVEKAK